MVTVLATKQKYLVTLTRLEEFCDYFDGYLDHWYDWVYDQTVITAESEYQLMEAVRQQYPGWTMVDYSIVKDIPQSALDSLLPF